MEAKNKLGQTPTPPERVKKEIPDSLRHNIAYHAYWPSFQDTNKDGIGDLDGVRRRLKYISQDLGANVVYINPFNPSPKKDFYYDVSDFKGVAQEAGTLESVKALTTEAHNLGMKVIFDFVPNHTSDQHPWFQESASSKDSPYRDWYVWRKGKGEGIPPNNWLSVICSGEPKSAWTYDHCAQEWYLHSFLPEQPDLNWENPKVRQEMYDTMRFWFGMGVDGLRIDSVYWLGKDLQFRDEEPNPRYRKGIDDPYESLQHKNSFKSPNMYKYLSEMAAVASEFLGRFIVPEAYTEDIDLIKSFYEACKDRGAPFNFNLISRPLDSNIKGFLKEFQAKLSSDEVPIYVLGNHDRSRVATRAGGEKQARVAATLLLTLPGMPFIYYGDEIGMQDVPIPPDKRQDPWGKSRPELGLGRDPERTPMQWDKSPNGGFSDEDVEPWLPVGADYRERNVAGQMQDNKSIWTLYKKLIELRKSSPELKSPNYEPVDTGDKPVVAYIRSDEKQKFLVLLNFSGEPEEISLPYGNNEVVLDSNLNRQEKSLDLNKAELLPHEAVIVKLTE